MKHRILVLGLVLMLAISFLTVPGHAAVDTYAELAVDGATEMCALTSLRWDLRGDGVVDYKDLAVMGASYGTTAGDSGFNPAADINMDGVIDYKDLSILGAYYGEKYVWGLGTVTYIYLEGGFYGIVGDRGEHYDPINLREEYKVDGLQVAFLGKVRDDLANFHMWGIIIEIICIERVVL